ncbi:uncharacterized protein LOC134214735 [Armigeres subalbatus]|uniref:uncharacterized protein LOC134214735 n=1 Tax=Armigeres subalbatus TaxID=124917 RepID=UPI002ED32579
MMWKTGVLRTVLLIWNSRDARCAIQTASGMTTDNDTQISAPDDAQYRLLQQLLEIHRVPETAVGSFYLGSTWNRHLGSWNRCLESSNRNTDPSPGYEDNR